jgi:hypothetical protein
MPVAFELISPIFRRAAGGVDLVELGGLLAQGGVCLLRLGGEAFLVPGKVEHVDPGGAEPGGQLLQRGPALLQPLRGLAGLALDFLELGPQLLRGGFGRVELLAQGGQPCLQGLVLARVVRIAGLGGLVAAHLLLLRIERLELLVRARQILTRGGRGAGDRPERAGQPVQPFEDDLQAKVTVGHQRLLSVSGARPTGGVITPAHQVGQGHRLHGGGRPVEDDRHVGHGIVYCARASVRRAFCNKKLPISAPQARRSAGSMLATSAGLSGGSVMRGNSTPSASTLSWPRSTRASPRNSPALGLRI